MISLVSNFLLLACRTMFIQPMNPSICFLNGKRDSACVIKLRIWKWGGFSGLPGWDEDH